MDEIVVLLFLFFIGSFAGWCIELVFRRFFGANNPEHKWINPGFLTGPYLPIYGFGLLALYLIVVLPINVENDTLRVVVILLLIAVAMTVIEYIAGLIFIKKLHVRLWDYTGQWGNIQGIICPLFSFFWAVLGAVYYFFIHPHIIDALRWLSQNMAFCLVIGFFYGVFTIDLISSFQLVAKMKQFAEEKNVVIRYEALKSNIRKAGEERKEKLHFFFAFRSEVPFREHLEKYPERMVSLHGRNLPEQVKKRREKRR